ncbi:hypothetical protein BPNPMPFG_000299 [Mesorhizobium sp. AR07]|uniref:hypothetical protein n=1 Tax=Mesorhizobium sp. AR07 TaxID=2865838 RepID=UPI00216018BB|nr:hypothetical protein [Mesorhizobium sp. AR07]UVK44834.1 hypothetical protein BPNPMPFG_000299 [Mesorhizobium sp. AR07]
MNAQHYHALPEALSLLDLPRGKVRSTVERLKAANSITRGNFGGHESPPITARDVATILLALASPTASGAAVTATTLGRLPIYYGSGPPTALDAITSIVEVGAFMRCADIPQDGELILGVGRPEMIVRSGDTVWHYRPDVLPLPAARFTLTIPIKTIADISRRLLIN